MPDTSHKYFMCVLNIIESAQKIQDYSEKFSNTDDFYHDTKSFDASMMNFVIIGEMVEKLSEGYILETKDYIDWFKTKGFRNIVAHNYFGIDADEIWEIISNKIKPLKESLKAIENNS